jgi:hypothetical protein
MAESTEIQPAQFAEGSEQSIVAAELAKCDDRESRFITAMLNNATAEDAAREVGYSGRAVGARVLGRPRIKAAILAIAPYLEVKAGARLAAPYVLERVMRVAVEGSDAQAIHAARDVLNLAGLGPVSRSETIHASLASVLDVLERRRRDESGPTVEVTPRKR